MADQRAIQLQRAHWKGAEHLQRCVTGAEVIHRQGHTHRGQLVQRVPGTDVAVYRTGLGDLEFERARGQVVPAERGRHVPDEGQILQLPDRHIHRHPRRSVAATTP